MSEKNQNLSKSLDEFLAPRDDLEFEDMQLEIAYTNSTYSRTQKITLKEIFKYVSINLIAVSKVEGSILDLIAQSVGANSRFSLTDKNIAKRICNQFIALKLMYTSWSKENKRLYYGLTKKGERLRDEMNLFKKGSR